MEPQKYLDFDLEIVTPRADGLCVVSVRSPGGEAEGVFDPGLLPETLLTAAISPTSTLQEARTLGGALYNALFHGEIGVLFDVSRQLATSRQAGLRVRLRVGGSEVRFLPWELLFDARTDEFLALSRETPLVRYLPLAAPQERLTVQPPLRILALAANPSDLPPVHLEQEKERLDAAVERLKSKGRVEVVWLEGQSWRALQEAMQGGPWHIFHYVGHARFNPQEQSGELILVGEDGLSAPISAAQLGSLLEDQQSLRLAVLNACEGARSDEALPFSSIAATLVRSGLPAVLAMQYEISARQAGELTRGFYTALASNLPVDAAVAEARKAMILAVPASVEWVTPVLFMRSPDGVLFETLPVRSPLVTYLLAGGASALLLLALWALTYWYMIPQWWPKQMPGSFSIAVAGIGTIDENGKMHRSELGDKLSLTIYERLESEFRVAQQGDLLPGSVTVWHDSLGRTVKNVRFGLIDGATDEERTAEAAWLAGHIGARMVVYGYLVTGPQGGEELQLAFYNAAPVENGEPAPTAGNLIFGSPIANPVPFAKNEDGALANLVGPAEQRASILYWITRAIVLENANEHATALKILDKAYTHFCGDPCNDPPPGLELVQLFRASAALYLRDYKTATDAVNLVLKSHGEYVNALMLKGNILTDRSQIYYVMNSAPTSEESVCPAPKDVAIPPPGQETKDAAEALGYAVEAVKTLEEAAELVQKSTWSDGPTYVQMNLGIARRSLGMALIFAQEYDKAEAALSQTAADLQSALEHFSPENQPQYIGWTQAALGSTRRLQAYIPFVEEYYARIEKDLATAAARHEESIAFLEQAVTAFDACLAQREPAAGSSVFLERVLDDACVPYACEAKETLKQMRAETPVETQVESQSATGGQQ